MPAKKDSSNGGSGKMTKEEERLLLENSRQVTGTASALFYGNAFIVSALPVCEYTDTHCDVCSYCLCAVQGCIGVCR